MANIGIDLVEIDRLLDIKDSFVKHVLSLEEIEIFNSYNGKRQKEFLAGRFACKEAIIKCLSSIEIPNMRDLIILNDSHGKPYIKYKNYNLSISITHETHYAAAVCLLND